MSEKLFYTMGEVAEMFDVNQSLIRYWESQFRVLRPKRNKKGNRLFTPEDIRNLKLIYHLVKERGMTLDGAKKALRQAAADGAAMNRDAELMERLQHIRSLLEEVREDLKSGTPEGESAAEAAAVDERPARRRRERPVVKIAPEAAAVVFNLKIPTHPARQIIQFLAQRVHIFIHPLFPFGKGIGRKRTVQAGARAERNAHIQAVSMLIINIPQHIPLPVGNHDAQGRLFLAGKILLPHILRRFHIAHAFLQHQHGKPRRADPCQSPPGQRLTRICLQDPV